MIEDSNSSLPVVRWRARYGGSITHMDGQTGGLTDTQTDKQTECERKKDRKKEKKKEKTRPCRSTMQSEATLVRWSLSQSVCWLVGLLVRWSVCNPFFMPKMSGFLSENHRDIAECAGSINQSIHQSIGII